MKPRLNWIITSLAIVLNTGKHGQNMNSAVKFWYVCILHLPYIHIVKKEILFIFSCFTLQKFIVGRIRSLSTQFELQTPDYYNNILAFQYQERKEQLIAALQNAIWVSTTTDCWSSYGKYLIGITVQWYDNNFRRNKACLGVTQLVGLLESASLADYLYDIHKELTLKRRSKLL